MKRTAADIIRRGFDSAVVNWPALLIRIAESVVFVIIAVAAVFALIVPLFVSIGLSHLDLANAEDAASALVRLLVEHWMILVYVALLATAVLIVFIAVHSFVQAGLAHIFGDAERAAGALPVSRIRLRAFNIDRWLEGGWRSWWPVFLIYNIAWTFAGLVMLVPLIVVVALMLLARQSGAAVAVGCLGLVASFFVIMIVAVLTGIWTQKAIVLSVLRRLGAIDSLGDAWRDALGDFGRHFAVAFVMLVIVIGGTSVISTFSLAFSVPASHPFVMLAFSPIRILLSFVSSAFSAAVANWFLASFVALSAEERT